MVLPLYLAMTAAEIQNSSALPERIAWMACHFSAYGKGISNAPASLPPGSALILNDRIPPFGHDPAIVARELAETIEQTGAQRLLLDFQRPGIPLLGKITHAVIAAVPCPVAVSTHYGQALTCPVFLLPKLHKPLGEQLQAYAGREIWLEAALEYWEVTVTAQGSHFLEIPPEDGEFPHVEESLHFRYRTQVAHDHVRFTLSRDEEQLRAHLAQAAELGVRCAFGLYQQLSADHNRHSEERSDVGIRPPAVDNTAPLSAAEITDCHASSQTGSQ